MINDGHGMLGMIDDLRQQLNNKETEVQHLAGKVLLVEGELEAARKRETMLRKAIDQYGHGRYCPRRFALVMNPSTTVKCECYMKEALETGNLADMILCKWKPIATAPKDGTDIIVRDGVGGVHGAKWTTHKGITDWFHHCNLEWIPSAKWWMPMLPASTLNNEDIL